MAFINLLPSTVKKVKRVPAQEHKKTSPPPAAGTGMKFSFKLPVFWPILAVTGALIAVLAMQFMQLGVNKKTLNTLEKQLADIKLGYQKINELNKKKGELSDTLSFIQKFSAPEVLWSDTLSTISKLIPPQIWLTNITIESKPVRENARAKTEKNEAILAETTRQLTIKGSATSLIEAEIIASITQFVEVLKKNATFAKDFSDIKLGPLQSDRKGNLIIMNFVIYCKSSKYL